MRIDTLDKNEILKVDILCKKIIKYERVDTPKETKFQSDDSILKKFYYTPRRFNASF